MTHIQYQVIQNYRPAASGTLRQCWLYLFNTINSNTTAEEMSERGIYIEPTGKGE